MVELSTSLFNPSTDALFLSKNVFNLLSFIIEPVLNCITYLIWTGEDSTIGIKFSANSVYRLLLIYKPTELEPFS